MKIHLALTATAVATLALAGCGSSSQPYVAPTASASSASASMSGHTVALAATAKGQVLTVDGRSLYMFDHDAANATTSACTGACASTWPFVKGPLTVSGTGLDQSDFKTITRSDGSTQATYYGKPLYTYSGDTAAGQTNGDGIGGVWHLAKPESSSSTQSSTPQQPVPRY